MSYKKIIIIILIITAALIMLLNFAFKKIQTVEMKIQTLQTELSDEELINVIAGLNNYKDIVFIGDVKLSDFQILLINHVNLQAALWQEGSYSVVDYNKLDPAIINSNSYMAYAANIPTVVLNCDEILGDAVERAISLSYRYMLGNFNKLNPSGINYFQTIEEDVRVHYYRYEMIEALKSAYFDNENLERFGYFYHKWNMHLGEKYLRVAEYDYYDGFKAYIELKVKVLQDSEYDMRGYIDNMINEYGVYSKKDEYKLMGLFWFLIADREGLDMLMRDDVRVDQYKLLLEGTPYISIDEEESWIDFNVKYEQYTMSIEQIIEICVRDDMKLTPVMLNLLSESYNETVKIEDSHYIYTDFRARLVDGQVIRKDFILAKVEPYKIKYYIDLNK